MKYNVIGRANPLDRQAEKKFYAVSKSLGNVNLNEICNDISISSSLTRGDVTNTIMSFIDSIPKYLKMGYSVSLGELGTFRLSIQSKGEDSPTDVNAGCIKKIRPVFTQSARFRKEISDTHVEKWEG
ncbi:putative histone-like DNA-binding protein [Dysgonomonadaceae bacterium PH5-43]|nr:putative histone-like DNA-binding protein [Dysgonomonadaceae bacterium PH5-43]